MGERERERERDPRWEFYVNIDGCARMWETRESVQCRE